jgi:hypothetical protein
VILKVLLLLFPILLLSCKETSKDLVAKPTAELSFESSFEGQSSFLNYRQKVENRKDFQRLSSLFFTHKSGYTIKSEAFLDPKGEILKAYLEKVDTFGLKVQYTFYFLKEVLSMAQVVKTHMHESTEKIEDSFIFYNANQSPIACYFRQLVNGEQAPYKAVATDKKSNEEIDLALQMLSQMQNQTGSFSLQFQGFDEAFNKKFVQFGNTEFSTNLAYAPTDEEIASIKSNPEAVKNQNFLLQFQDIQEASGLQYQVLTALQKK